MGGLLVAGRILRGAIDLLEDEAGGIILLLDHIEAHHPGFAHAVAGVLERGRAEGLNLSIFDTDVDVDDEHGERGKGAVAIG